MKSIKILISIVLLCMFFASCEKENELKVINNEAKINKLEATAVSRLMTFPDDTVTGVKLCLHFYVSLNLDFPYESDVELHVKFGTNSQLSDVHDYEYEDYLNWKQERDNERKYFEDDVALNSHIYVESCCPVSYLEDVENGQNIIIHDDQIVINPGIKIYYQPYLICTLPHSKEKYVVYGEMQMLEVK